MDPLLKWPGGKRRELGRLVPLVPEGTKRMVEPFAGGAALTFALEPEAALLNDADRELVNLYRRLASGSRAPRPAFRELLSAWEAGQVSSRPRSADLLRLFLVGAPVADVTAVAHAWARDVVSATGRRLLTQGALERIAASAVSDKVRRLPKLRKDGMTDEQTREQLRTALLAGFYGWLRDCFEPADDDEAAARFWFIRELCYGSLMRYNAAGRLNVPYGGASYNDLPLRAKVDRLLAPETAAVLARIAFSSLDFRTFFAGYAPREGDLVFLDPPYLGGFSAYGGRAFGRAEHEALALIVGRLEVPTLVVIGAHPFVEKLYRHVAPARSNFLVTDYEHTYGSNIRGRNARAARHLVVTNYAVEPVTRAA